MPSLVATVFEEFRQFHSPVLRVFRKKVKKACKKAYKKLTSAFHKPNNRVHCENTPYFCSVAVQTTSEPLIQSLSHGGELDMSYHLNSNQSNNRGVSRPLIHGQGSSTGQTKPPRSSTVLPDKLGFNSSSSSKKSTSSVGASTSYPFDPRRSQGHSSRDTMKSTSSVGASTSYPSDTRRSQGHSSRDTMKSVFTGTTLPLIGAHSRSESPKTRRRSSSLSDSSKSSTASRVPTYRPKPPSNSPPPKSPARQRRHAKKTTQKEDVMTKESPTNLHRSSSLSSIVTSMSNTSLNHISDAEDYLQSKMLWSGNLVPEYLKVTVPVATKAEETPVTSTLVPSQGRHVKPVADTASPRHVKPVADAASPRREVPKNSVDKPDSPTTVFTKFLRSLKKCVKSKHTQITPPGLEGALITGGIVGLSNLGNTCFMNSALQCLSHTLEMTQEFLRTDCHAERRGVERAYARLMQDMWFKPSSLRSRAANPQEVKTTLARVHSMFAGYGQQDCQELLRLLLSELHEEMKANSKQHKSNKLVPITGLSVGEERWWSYFQHEDTPISRVFMGQLRSTLICDACKGASTTFDPFWDIALPIPKSSHGSRLGVYAKTKYLSGLSLEDCISHFTKEEILDGSNKAYCTSCRSLKRTCKQMTINRFPPVLVMYLQRFSLHSYRTKLDTHVDIPTELDLTSYASKESVEGLYLGKRIKYELYAICNHMGGITFGHYTALVKHYATGHWYLCNDSSVRRETNIDRYLKNSAPYMMFYRRTL